MQKYEITKDKKDSEKFVQEINNPKSFDNLNFFYKGKWLGDYHTNHEKKYYKSMGLPDSTFYSQGSFLRIKRLNDQTYKVQDMMLLPPGI